MDDRPMREIDETALSAADDRFEAIINRVKEKGGEILKDEEGPLYADIGSDEVEIGKERVVEFNLNGMDFQIKRQVREARITGEGIRKSIEKLDRPSVDLKLKRKPELEDQWVAVDIEEMF